MTSSSAGRVHGSTKQTVSGRLTFPWHSQFWLCVFSFARVEPSTFPVLHFKGPE